MNENQILSETTSNSIPSDTQNKKPPRKIKVLLIVLLIIAVLCFAPVVLGAIIAIVLAFGFIPSAIYLLFFRKKFAGNPKQRKLNITSGITLALSLACWAFILMRTPPVPIETLEISARQLEMDIVNQQELILSYTPNDASIDNINFTISDESLLVVSKNDNKFYLNTLENEGSVTITAISNEVESNSISIDIVDQKRIAAEKKAEEERIAAEKKAEEARIAAEKKAEEARIAAEKKAEEERIAAEKKAAASVTTDNSPTVYVTPTGKKYHYDNSCNGGTYRASTLSKATSMGLTPCKKCVY